MALIKTWLDSNRKELKGKRENTWSNKTKIGSYNKALESLRQLLY